MIKFSPILSLLILLSLLSGCSVERMRYTRGIHLQWPGNGGSKTNRENTEGMAAKNIRSAQDDNISAGISNGPENLLTNPIGMPDAVNDSILPKDSCHIIYLNDDSKIYTKYISIGDYTIKYVDCNYSNKLREIKKEEVTGIVYKNGVAESMEALTVGKMPDTLNYKQPPIELSNNVISERSAEKPSRRALIFGICAFIPVVGWIFTILSFTNAMSALRIINSDPSQEKYRKTANTGLYLGLIALTLGIILLILSATA